MVPMSNREVTGSLFERNGCYTAVLNLYDKNGKRRQKSVALGIPVKGNKRKAQARAAEETARYEAQLRSPAELNKRIRQLEEQMYQLARELQFEEAAQLRDEIQALRERLLAL